jgi:hypothetical protein
LNGVFGGKGSPFLFKFSQPAFEAADLKQRDCGGSEQPSDQSDEEEEAKDIHDERG